jgi:hypothetical protein
VQNEQYNLAMELLRFVVPPGESESVFEALEVSEELRQREEAAAESATSRGSPRDASNAGGGATTGAVANGGDGGSNKGWLSWVWGSSSSPRDANSYRTSCAAVIARPLIAVSPSLKPYQGTSFLMSTRICVTGRLDVSKTGVGKSENKGIFHVVWIFFYFVLICSLGFLSLLHLRTSLRCCCCWLLEKGCEPP